MKTLKILFVGNSYTYFNDMPNTYFKQEAENAGYKVDVSSVTSGGYRLLQFTDPEDGHCQQLRKTIEGQHYDFVVLQEQSLNPIKNEEEFLAGVKGLKEMISTDCFVLYATWGRNDGSANLEELGLTRQEMTEKLSLAYNKAAELYGMRVAEVGYAFLEYSENKNKDDLYNPDKSHPSPLGSEVAAKVILKAMIK
jgi:hypothetical protein